ncbi:hypothetical protein L249_2330 [Ophiocordyceps polyrhachis-furcata BCC 54312]|uniref:Uncharacterized protein n=1 Tax=Ophiocordyceps polyrhachis-furcata BCC 54312 TaxID=1330021 RepID=A0A367LNW8_9HYPO|nr:hypothetical protein L249_2330 [Ophiocordyceps polyrhachis-furcata BCC 54312]
MTDSDTKKAYSIRTPEQSASSPHTPQREMLSVDFSSPSVGLPRAERLKQMAVHHVKRQRVKTIKPAFAKLRHTQDILVKAQHALRRMPGHDANDLVSSLQEVGQMVSGETTQLVDAIMNLTLDQEDSEQAMARMSIDANLAQAKTKDQLQSIVSLRADVKAERERREAAEVKARSALETVESLKEEIKRLREASGHDHLVQVGESASRQGSPPPPPPPPPPSHPRPHPHRHHHHPINVERPDVLLSSSSSSWTTPQNSRTTTTTTTTTEMGPPPPPQCRQVVRHVDNGTTPVRVAAASVFQATTPLGPPKFGPLQVGPPRAPASMARGGGGSWGRSVSTFAPPSTGLFQQAQTSSRRGNGGGAGGGAGGGGFQPLPRYRSADQHQQHHNHNHNHNHHNNNNDAFSHHQQLQHQYRPATAMGRRDNYFPTTPPFGGGGGGVVVGGGSGGAGAGAGAGGGGGPAAAAGRSGRFGRFTDSSGSGPVIQLTDRAIGAWNEQIVDLYGSIRHFVSRHAGEPDGGGSIMAAGSGGLWPVLLAMYHPLSEHEATSYLDFHLRSESSKCCVVTRVIVDYVVNRVWVAGAWTGSDSRTSYELLDVERDLEATSSSSSSARQSLLNQQASIISQIMKNEQGTNWHRNKMDDISRSLQGTLQPLMNRFFNHGDARRDLDRVAEAAWELSSKMLASRLTFDFRFPDIGARFSSQSMLPIWPRLEPAELQAKHWRVAFVTTPVITCRNDTGVGISAHSVALADVFCMQ